MPDLAFRLRVLALRVRLLLLYAWRRGSLSARLPDMVEPDARGQLPTVDTSGAYRPPFGSQFSDPQESHGSPHSEGSNCTMAAAGMALDYQGVGGHRGGDMRHHQADNDGGTDLYDAAQAWAHYGEPLSIRSGQGWGAVIAALEDGRGVILQGTGGLAGCGDYSGGHAIYVNPERSGSRWLKGDPECSGWEWCEARDLEAFAERLSGGVYFAVTGAQGAPGEVDMGLKVNIAAAWSGDVTVTASGASAIQLADRQLVGLPAGAVKRGYWRGSLAEAWGAAWPVGTPVVGIGTEAAVVIEAQARLTPDALPPSDDYNLGRLDEWQTWAESQAIPPRPEV